MTVPRITAASMLLIGLAACGRKPGVLPLVPSTTTLVHLGRIVEEQATINRVPPALIFAIIAVESGGNPRATGPSGSIGLMQLKRATASQYGVTDLFDPTANITAGARYLHALLARFYGSVPLAVAAYNAGPGAVAAAHGIPARTRGYVDRVMAIYDDAR